jgi:hypothetical protein
MHGPEIKITIKTYKAKLDILMTKKITQQHALGPGKPCAPAVILIG